MRVRTQPVVLGNIPDFSEKLESSPIVVTKNHDEESPTEPLAEEVAEKISAPEQSRSKRRFSDFEFRQILPSLTSVCAGLVLMLMVLSGYVIFDKWSEETVESAETPKDNSFVMTDPTPGVPPSPQKKLAKRPTPKTGDASPVLVTADSGTQPFPEVFAKDETPANTEIVADSEEERQRKLFPPPEGKIFTGLDEIPEAPPVPEVIIVENESPSVRPAVPVAPRKENVAISVPVTPAVADNMLAPPVPSQKVYSYPSTAANYPTYQAVIATYGDKAAASQHPTPRPEVQAAPPANGHPYYAIPGGRTH